MVTTRRIGFARLSDALKAHAPEREAAITKERDTDILAMCFVTTGVSAATHF